MKDVPLRQWDSVSLAALVWSKQVLSSDGLTEPPPRDLWTRAASNDDLVRAALSRHRIIPPAAAWLASNVANPVSLEIGHWLTAERRTNQRQVIAHLAAAACIQDALSRDGVNALFFKGPFQAKQATGDPAGRGSGDVDLIVDPEQFGQAIASLMSAGAKLIDGQLTGPLAEKIAQVHHAAILEFSGITVDVHRRLDPNPDRMRLRFDALWRERDMIRLAGVDFPTLSPSDSCLLVASHGCRDNWLQIRQLVDFAQSLNRVQADGLDLSDLRQRAVEHGITRRLAVALAVTRIVIPELPDQTRTAKQFARWTWSRYRSGQTDVGSRTPRQATSMFTYSTLTEDGLHGPVFAARRLIWFTSTNVDPLVPNQALWTYPFLAPANVIRRMLKQPQRNLDRRSSISNSSDLTRRERLLLMIVMDTHPIGARQAWEQWKELASDIDGVTPTEISLLSIAWQKAHEAGATHAALGRLKGLQRRAYVHATSILLESARVQQSLADRGIQSALTAEAAAALEYPTLSRWPLSRAELWVEGADLKAALAPNSASPSERILGRCHLPGTSAPIALRWQHLDHDLGLSHSRATYIVNWQGRQLRVTQPHIAAWHSLVRVLPASKPGAGASFIALLDLHFLSKNPQFDRELFIHIRRRSIWNPVLASHTRAGLDFLSPDLVELLADSRAVRKRNPSLPNRSPLHVMQDAIAHNLPRALHLGNRTLL